MANEIRVTASLQVTNGSHSPGAWKASLTVDQAAEGEAGAIQNIGTSEEALGAGDLSTKGWLVMQNLDDTNYVEWGTTGAYVGKMEAGEFAIFRTGGAAAPYLKANTAACNVWYRWLED